MGEHAVEIHVRWKAKQPAETVSMSCRNTYSALNALAGHYNSFGATAPVPKKRMERIQKVRGLQAWQKTRA
jgi:hypothetical protein